MNMKWIKRYWVILFVIIFYAFLLCQYFTHFNAGFSNENADWGTFGDFLGGALSPLIGIISIILTYNIINNQTLESRQTEFINMFQILFDSISEKEALIERKGRPNLIGKKALFRINKDIESVYKSEKKNNPTSNNIELFEKSFWSVYDDIKGSSSPYMKVMHNCLKAIDKHCLDDRKETYSSLLRAQLHPDELIFIFYNAIASNDFKDFKSRIEKYSLLKDIDGYNLPQELKELYNSSAFKEDKNDTIS